MKHLKTFESINLNNCYRFGGKVVKIISLEELTSSEISVSFTYEDGTIGHFNDTYKDFEEAYIEIECSKFKSKYNKTIKKEPILQQSKTPPKIDNKRFDLVYYVGNKLMNVVQKNIPAKLAYSLKHTYKHRPEYKYGRLEVKPTNYV